MSDTLPDNAVTLKLTPRQAEALRALAAKEGLPPEVYAAEVLVHHLYHEYARPAEPRGRSEQ